MSKFEATLLQMLLLEFVNNKAELSESVAGHVPSHTFAVYSGTKFALTAISQSLRRELAQKGSTIKVTNVSPGLTWSETTTKNLGDAGMEMMAASDVAQAIVDVLSATAVTQVCEVVLTPVPTIEYIY
ncbi:Dehydrogenase/reductase SDR member 11 [Homalodisca vitripennis]|nr:Dehydrogenase/reductase SDR member 11 [Homalodisca vitripennis]